MKKFFAVIIICVLTLSLAAYISFWRFMSAGVHNETAALSNVNVITYDSKRQRIFSIPTCRMLLPKVLTASYSPPPLPASGPVLKEYDRFVYQLFKGNGACSGRMLSVHTVIQRGLQQINMADTLILGIIVHNCLCHGGIVGILENGRCLPI